MESKIMCSFRLKQATIQKLDALVEWQKNDDERFVTSLLGGRFFANRTHVLERLVLRAFNEIDGKKRLAVVNGEAKKKAARRRLAPSIRTRESEGKKHGKRK